MSKRTLDAFFKPKDAPQKRAKNETSTASEPTNGPPSSHPTYPFPIPGLPSHIEVGLTHGTPALEGRTITNQPDLDLLYFQPYIPRPTANELFKFLRAELPFYRVQYSIKRFGRETQINTPRYTTVFGVDDTAKFKDTASPDSSSPNHLVSSETNTPIPATKYQYPPRPIPQCLAHLKSLVETATSAKYNFCLVNYYSSGEDSISFHSDDERFLGDTPCIASLSLGGEREFLMKHKPAPEKGSVPQRPNSDVAQLAATASVKMPLASGDMVIMRGRTQAHWLHSIPKRRGRAGDAVRGRINITFRRARIPAGTNNYYHYNVGSGGIHRWSEEKRAMVDTTCSPGKS